MFALVSHVIRRNSCNFRCKVQILPRHRPQGRNLFLRFAGFEKLVRDPCFNLSTRNYVAFLSILLPGPLARVFLSLPSLLPPDSSLSERNGIPGPGRLQRPTVFHSVEAPGRRGAEQDGARRLRAGCSGPAGPRTAGVDRELPTRRGEQSEECAANAAAWSAGENEGKGKIGMGREGMWRPIA